MKRPLLYLLILLVTVFSTSCTQFSKGTFEVGDKTFLLNGEPFVVKAAEIHYPRIPKEYWEHRIKMSKALGMNTIAFMFSGTSMNRKKENMILPGKRILQHFVVLHRRMVCTSLCVLVLMCVQSGRWADCLGGY